MGGRERPPKPEPRWCVGVAVGKEKEINSARRKETRADLFPYCALWCAPPPFPVFLPEARKAMSAE